MRTCYRSNLVADCMPSCPSCYRSLSDLLVVLWSPFGPCTLYLRFNCFIFIKMANPTMTHCGNPRPSYSLQNPSLSFCDLSSDTAMIPNVRHLVGEGGQSGRPCWRTNRPLIIPRPNDTEAANTRGRNFVSSKQGGEPYPAILKLDHSKRF